MEVEIQSKSQASIEKGDEVMAFADLMSHFTPHRKVRLGTRTNYQLTALGKTKADKLEAGGPMWEVLAYLDENGQSTLRDISEGTRFSQEKTKEVVKRLVSSGYVVSVSTE